MAVRKSVNATEERKVRPPLADRRDRMWFPKNPNFKRIVVTEGKLRDYLESGFKMVSYEEIKDECGSVPIGEGNIDQGSQMSSYVSWNVGRADGQENATGYLLQMTMEDYTKLRKEISKYRQDPVEDLLKGRADHQKGFYGGVKLETEK